MPRDIVLPPDVEITPEALRESLANSAMDSPERLNEFLTRSGREFLVMHATTLVRALPWPGGVQTMQEVVGLYAAEREKSDTGWFRAETRPDGRTEETPFPFGDRLTPEEIERAIVQLDVVRKSLLKELEDQGAYRGSRGANTR